MAIVNMTVREMVITFVEKLNYYSKILLLFKLQEIDVSDLYYEWICNRSNHQEAIKIASFILKVHSIVQSINNVIHFSGRNLSPVVAAWAQGSSIVCKIVRLIISDSD